VKQENDEEKENIGFSLADNYDSEVYDDKFS